MDQPKRAQIAAFLLVTLSAAVASATRFDAKVSADSITLADTIQLTITLDHDGNTALESYRPPAMPDFDVLQAVEGSNGLSFGIQLGGGPMNVRSVEQHL